MTTPMLRARRLTPGDRKAVVALNEVLAARSRFVRQELTEVQIEAFLRAGEGSGLVALGFEDEGNAIVGMALVVTDAKVMGFRFEGEYEADGTAYLLAMVAHEQVVSEGVGREMLDTVLGTLVDLGKRRLVIDVDRGNTRVYDWARRVGFHELGAQVYMVKRLT
jgi:GNAT superfamily N-acetyltransferase